MSSARGPNLYICTTCTGASAQGARTAADYDAAGEPRPGAALFEAVQQRLEANPDGSSVEVTPVVCLANCEQGCSVAVAEHGKWGYLIGGIGPEHADDLVAYGQTYAASRTGTVMRKNRPESLHHAFVARMPVPGINPEDEAFRNRTVTK